MKRMMILIILAMHLTMPVSALEIEAPPVPDAGSRMMPEKTDSFPEALAHLADKALDQLHPELRVAAGAGVRVFVVSLLLSLLKTVQGKGLWAAELAGITGVSVILLSGSHTLVNLAAETVRELSDYGKLLFPVMTAALAAQGGVTKSAALYRSEEAHV